MDPALIIDAQWDAVERNFAGYARALSADWSANHEGQAAAKTAMLHFGARLLSALRSAPRCAESAARSSRVPRATRWSTSYRCRWTPRPGDRAWSRRAA